MLTLDPDTHAVQACCISGVFVAVDRYWLDDYYVTVCLLRIRYLVI